MKKTKATVWIAIIIFALIMLSLVAEALGDNILVNEAKNNIMDIFTKKTLNIIASQENEDLEEVIQNYAKTKNYDINIEYAGTLDVMEKLNSGENYDAVWVSNSIWLYMLDDNVKVSNSKYTSINPIVFGIKKSKAKELGFTDKTIKTKDIVNAISSGKLKFSMSNPTSTNSGASAYLGFLYTLAGNPEVLKKENLQNKKLVKNLTTLFTGLERSSGSEDFLEEIFLNGNYEAVVTYESSIININKKLQQQGKETLYAIYPMDGVSISDSPFAYIDNKDEKSKEIFLDLQSYILSNEGQKLLQAKGRRTWYGGVNSNVNKSIFNPEWGLDTTKYISPVKYPSTEVIKLALNLYQSELRKPVHVAFCLDYSGSMTGTGYAELMNAMNYILSDEAANDFLQFSAKDKIDIIPFNRTVLQSYSTDNGTKTEQLLTNIRKIKPNDTTALYPAVIEALMKLSQEDMGKYNVSIIAMTDGKANVGTFSKLKTIYNRNGKSIPIYSIMFGSAAKQQLQDMATLSNGKVFDGKQDLKKAFKEVRGYN